MAEDEKDQDLPTEELEDEEELLEEPAEPEEDEVKCEECAPVREVPLLGWRRSRTWRRCSWPSLF